MYPPCACGVCGVYGMCMHIADHLLQPGHKADRTALPRPNHYNINGSVQSAAMDGCSEMHSHPTFIMWQSLM